MTPIAYSDTASPRAHASCADAGMIPVQRVGRIVAGDDAGCYVQILPDDGHFVLYISRQPDMRAAFDGWMYDMQDVQWYFSHSGWQVQWLDAALPLPTPTPQAS